VDDRPHRHGPPVHDALMEPGRAEVSRSQPADEHPVAVRSVSGQPDEDGPSAGAEDLPLIRGRHLRYLAVLILDRAQVVMTPSQLDQAIALAGHRTAGPPGKAVADALRWAIEHGQVTRVGHGRYAIGVLSKQTRHRYRARVAALRADARP
jgi:hypothetical protein